MNKFKSIRIISKKQWLIESKRIRYINDSTDKSKECDWQTKHTTDKEHISIFCSIGEWGSNLTDLLLDFRYDKYDFVKEAHRKALFRYYTKIFLISSEILTDFQDIIIYLKSYPDKKKQKLARQFLTNKNLTFTFQELMNYINHICKHKFGDAQKDSKYHLCNHHIEYEFEDSKIYRKNKINISTLNLANKQGAKIEVPKLIDIINQILFCYEKLDDALNDKTLNINTKLKPFIKTNTL